MVSYKKIAIEFDFWLSTVTFCFKNNMLPIGKYEIQRYLDPLL